jgi:hypothetical protein
VTVVESYVSRLRRLLTLVRTLQPAEQSPEVEAELATLEHDLRRLTDEVTVQEIRREVERRSQGDRRQGHVPVQAERRVTEDRRASDVSLA